MYPYFETIQLLDGELKNLEFHQERFERTRSKALGLKKHPLLGKAVKVPCGLEQGVLKCRVIYEKEIIRIEYEPHRPHEVHSLKMVYSDSIEYGFKYTDRSELEILFNQRENCDDILVVKNGCITDSFYANVVFWDGEGWITPETPLLPGTMRASLITAGAVMEEHITPDDLRRFQKVKLINAMNNLRNGPEIPIESIRF
ncbi:MAG: aminotransferase class IV family protein [Bacteroidales bacterium]|nr:aminotransferase class IV family protein [Bacteroidales bacterium]